MDFNPLSLLEVTMDSEVPKNSQEEDDDDECMIIDDPLPPPAVIINDEPIVIQDDTDVVPEVLQADPLAVPDIPVNEIDADAGFHFLNDAINSFLNGEARNNTSNVDLIAKNVQYLATVTPEEMNFRKGFFKDPSEVLKRSLHCTICRIHVGCDPRKLLSTIEHPLLKVLVCEKCCIAYKNLPFLLSPAGKDLRCRWCGKMPGRGTGAPLRFCSQCPFGFCEMCLYQNLPSAEALPRNWQCFGCNSRSIWPTRSILWALMSMQHRLPCGPDSRDFSHCAEVCAIAKAQKKKPQPKSRAKKSQPNKLQPIKPQPNKPQPNKSQANQKTIILNKINTNKQIEPQQLRMILTQSDQPVLPPSAPSSSQDATIPFPPSLLPCLDNSLKVNTTWLHSKIESYEKDIKNLVNKLKNLREGLAEEDSVKNINMRVETVTTLLSLNSSLLKDCGINLMHEWKEKRSRFQIDNINVNNIGQQVGGTAGSYKIVSVQPVGPNILKKKSPMILTAGRIPTKKLIFKKPNGSYCIDLEVEHLLEENNIKPCEVRLTKLPKPALDLLFKNGYVKASLLNRLTSVRI